MVESTFVIAKSQFPLVKTNIFSVLWWSKWRFCSHVWRFNSPVDPGSRTPRSFCWIWSGIARCPPSTPCGVTSPERWNKAVPAANARGHAIIGARSNFANLSPKLSVAKLNRGNFTSFQLFTFSYVPPVFHSFSMIFLLQNLLVPAHFLHWPGPGGDLKRGRRSSTQLRRGSFVARKSSSQVPWRWLEYIVMWVKQ